MDINFFNEYLINPAVLIMQIEREWRPYYKKEAFQNYEPEFHEIHSRVKRPDKLVKVPCGNDANGNETYETKLEYVARIAIAMQKIIVKRSVAFLNSGSISLKSDEDDANSLEVLKRINKTWSKNKLNFKNSEIAKAVMSQLEAAEVWYKDIDKKTGKIKMKVKIYYPSEGYDLMPVFDQDGDLIAFGIKYASIDENGKNRKYFNLYTNDELRQHFMINGEWILIDALENAPNPIPLVYGKIPVVYWCRRESEWQDVQNLIQRLETLMSNFADTVDYNGHPIILAKGNIEGFSPKGQQGKMLEMDAEADVSYLNIADRPEAIIYESEWLEKFIYALTQTPNISFDAIKDLGDISGAAFDRLFTDAHLKAKDYQDGWFGEGIQRRLNFLKAAEAAISGNSALDSAADNMAITPVFSIFSVTGAADRVDIALKANGNKPVMSQKESIAYVGISDDVEKTLEDINSVSEQPATTN